MKDIEFSSCHFVIPRACKLIEHLRASSCCTVVSFALPPVPFAPPCASVQSRHVISANSSRPFPGSPLCRGGITHGASTRLRCGTLCETSHTSCMYSFPLHCNCSRLPTPGPIVNSNLSALCPLIPLLPLLLPHHPKEAILPCDSCPAGVLPTPAPPSPTPLKLVPENTCPA